MSDIKIWHNARCSKSRETLKLLEQQGVQATIIDYLNTPPTIGQLRIILEQLGIDARQLLRTSEAIYKELNLKDPSLTDQQLMQAMCDNPKLIERPIVINNDRAKIGRPPEAILDII